MNNELRILHYYEISKGIKNGIKHVEPFLTFDIKECRDKQGVRIATYEDLIFELCCGEPIREGFFNIWNDELDITETITYFEQWSKNEFNEDILVDCGYRKAIVHELDVIVCNNCTIRNECEYRVVL